MRTKVDMNVIADTPLIHVLRVMKACGFKGIKVTDQGDIEVSHSKAPAEDNLSQEDAERLYAMARAGIELYNYLHGYLEAGVLDPVAYPMVRDALDEYDEKVDGHDD